MPFSQNNREEKSHFDVCSNDLKEKKALLIFPLIYFFFCKRKETLPMMLLLELRDQHFCNKIIPQLRRERVEKEPSALLYCNIFILSFYFGIENIFSMNIASLNKYVMQLLWIFQKKRSIADLHEKMLKILTCERPR